MNIAELAVMVIQAVVLILISPLVAGIIRKIKALMQNKVGASVFQPYRDLRKLMKKESVVSKNSSFLFRIIPLICITSMILLAAMTPFVYTKVIAPYSDVIAMVYIFTMFRFAMVLGGLEGGSTFGGMGSSREVMMSVLVEPALLISIMTLAAMTGVGFDITDISMSIIGLGALAISPALLLAGTSFVVTMVAENTRVPFDNPETHLELTMVHKGMLIEYSGKGLALMEMASMLRLTIFMALLGTLFFPWGTAMTLSPSSLIIAVVAISIKMLVIAFGIALLESTIAKLRVFRMPNMLTVSFALSLMAMISLYIL
ncbi:MAG TPA: NADH-quinone oxidoreductase subunit H [Candidatus Methanomethylophilaceae archaeon]|nr:NADH-quinone oxidoreductase subunit H [Candidatus Methanomethylophilaceae archaeon]